jgi:hypothetical protein
MLKTVHLKHNSILFQPETVNNNISGSKLKKTLWKKMVSLCGQWIGLPSIKHNTWGSIAFGCGTCFWHCAR